MFSLRNIVFKDKFSLPIFKWIHDSDNTVFLNIFLKEVSSWPSRDNKQKVREGFHVRNSLHISYLLSILIPPFTGYLGIPAILISLSTWVEFMLQPAKQTAGAMPAFWSYKWNPGCPLNPDSPVNFIQFKIHPFHYVIVPYESIPSYVSKYIQ